MHRADAENLWEETLPSEVLRLAGPQPHLSLRRSPYAASALKPASATRSSAQLPEGARIALGRPQDAFAVGSTRGGALAWLRGAAAAEGHVRLAYA